VSPWATGRFSIEGVDFPDLEQEPNNSASTANPLRLGEPVYGRMMLSGDVDWYKLTIPSPGVLTIKVTQPAGGGNWATYGNLGVTLTSADGSTTWLSTTSGGAGGTAATKALEVGGAIDASQLGEYRVRVYLAHNSGAWSDQPYTVTVVLRPIPGDVNNDCAVDIQDYNLVVGNYGRVGANVPGDANKGWDCGHLRLQHCSQLLRQTLLSSCTSRMVVMRHRPDLLRTSRSRPVGLVRLGRYSQHDCAGAGWNPCCPTAGGGCASSHGEMRFHADAHDNSAALRPSPCGLLAIYV
jgi:hypothetical protein